MPNLAEQTTDIHQASLQTLNDLTTQVFTGLENLIELNMNAARAIFGESFSHLQSTLGAEGPQELIVLQAGFFQLLAAKTLTYGQNVFTATTEAGAGFTQALEAQGATKAMKSAAFPAAAAANDGVQARSKVAKSL